MIGILCGRNKEKLFIDFVRKSTNLKATPVVIFSMPDVNLSERSVYGTVISEDTVKIVKERLPDHIYNFSVQRTKSHIKKLKLMSELENLTIYNPANAFNQWSIMKIITSDSISRRYLLPFATITKGIEVPDSQDSAGFILRPRNGNDHTKFTYCARTKTGFDIYNIGEIAYSHLHDIQSAVIPIVRSGKWIILFCPELMIYKNRLFTARSYLHKKKDGWSVALKTVLSQTEEVYKKNDEKTDAALVRMMEYINYFIPDLAFCTIDFTLDKDGNPYFLGLGGWQDLMPKKALHKTLVEAICSSLAEKTANNLEIFYVDKIRNNSE
jgi:hypothetical protein